MGIFFPHAKMLIKIAIRILASLFMPEVKEWIFVGYIDIIYFPFFPPPSFILKILNFPAVQSGWTDPSSPDGRKSVNLTPGNSDCFKEETGTLLGLMRYQEAFVIIFWETKLLFIP